MASNKLLSTSTSTTRPFAPLPQFTKKLEAAPTVYYHTWQKNKYLVKGKSYVKVKLITINRKCSKRRNLKISDSSQHNLHYSYFKKKKSSTPKLSYVPLRQNLVSSTKIIRNTHIHCHVTLSHGIISNRWNKMLRTQMSILAIPSHANARSLPNLEFSPVHWPSSTTSSTVPVN